MDTETLGFYRNWDESGLQKALDNANIRKISDKNLKTQIMIMQIALSDMTTGFGEYLDKTDTSHKETRDEKGIDIGVTDETPQNRDGVSKT